MGSFLQICIFHKLYKKSIWVTIINIPYWLHFMISLESKEPFEHLYTEFKIYLLTGNKNIQESVEQQYKNIHSDLVKLNHAKKRKAKIIERSKSNIKENGCKFAKLEGYGSLNSFKESLLNQEAKVVAEGNIGDLENETVMAKHQQKLLEKQVFNLKYTLNKLNNEIIRIKDKIQCLDFKQKKFVEANVLAKNIKQFVDQNSIINDNNYRKMLKDQNNVINVLKQIKNKSQVQLGVTNRQYHANQKQYDVRTKRLRKFQTVHCTREIKTASKKKVNNCLKFQRIFLKNVAQVLMFLKEKQVNYDQICQSYSNKYDFSTFNKFILPQDRIQWTSTVQSFENKYKIKAENLCEVLVKFYENIKQKNQTIEKSITMIKNQLQQNRNQLNFFKSYILKLSAIVNEKQQIFENPFSNQYPSNINKNSKVLVECFCWAEYLFEKIRHAYRIFVMLGISKVKFNQYLSHIDEQSANVRFFKERSQYSNKVNCKISKQQIIQICKNNFNEVSQKLVKDVIQIYYEDVRVNFDWKKINILQKISENKKSLNIKTLFNIFQSLRWQYQNNFHNKIEQQFKNLLECLSQVSKLQNSIPLITPQNQTARFQQHIEFFLPTMFSSQIPLDFQEEDETQNIQKEQQQKQINSGLQRLDSKASLMEVWGNSDIKNPSQMIRELGFIRNQMDKKINVLQLQQSSKKYIKIDVAFDERDYFKNWSNRSQKMMIAMVKTKNEAFGKNSRQLSALWKTSPNIF